jgi:hypothetical protein
LWRWKAGEKTVGGFEFEMVAGKEGRDPVVKKWLSYGLQSKKTNHQKSIQIK